MVCKDQVHFVDFVVQFHTEPLRHKVFHKVLPKESMVTTKFDNDIDQGHKGKEKEEEEKEYEEDEEKMKQLT